MANFFKINSSYVITNVVESDLVTVETVPFPPMKMHDDVNGTPVKGKIYDVGNNAVYFETCHNAGWILNNTTWEWEPPTPDPSNTTVSYLWSNTQEDWVLTATRDSEEDSWTLV